MDDPEASVAVEWEGPGAGAGPGPGVEGADVVVGVRAAALCMNLRFRVDDESPPAILMKSSSIITLSQV